jgi:hypothetical protein
LTAVTPGKKIAHGEGWQTVLVLLIDVYLTKVTPSKRKSPQAAVIFK